MSDDETTLYRIKIKTPVSPEELDEFCKLLEHNGGYTVVTNLKQGQLEVREDDE